MLTLADLTRDPVAAIASDPAAAGKLAHPERLAEALAPSLRSLGFGPASPASELLRAARTILDAAIADLPSSPRVVLLDGLARARRGVAFWEARPHPRPAAADERLAHYQARVERLQERLAAEGVDPLSDLRWSLLVAAERLATERVFAAYLAQVLRDLL